MLNGPVFPVGCHLGLSFLFVSHRKMLFDTPEEDANYNPLPEERPGGFPWGEGQRLGG